MHPSRGALDGVRVIELGNLVAAYCGKLLADMGADVIRIDASPRRSVSDPPFLQPLLASSDVLIDAAPQSPFDHDALCGSNPRLIVASITPFGRNGPHRDHQGSDLVCQAAGGMLYVNGHPDRPPLQGAGLPAYQAAALQTAAGIMLALLAREHTGRGQRIDVSVQECVAACVEPVSSRFFEDGTITQRQGTLHWTRHFRQTRCKDGYALLSTLGDWTTLIEWVKADGKAADLVDPQWEDSDYRRAHAEHLFDVLDGWAAGYSVADLVEAAQLRRLPFAPVQTVEALFEHPQLLARNFFVREPATGRLVAGAPYRFSLTPWQLRRGLPLFGEPIDDAPPALWERDRVREKSTSPRGSEHEPRPLHGVRVIDFSWVVAGPAATRILADHGAEVIKVEPLATADLANRRSGLFGNLNRGKHSVALNLNDERGLAIAKRLIATADVVLDNFSPRVMANWGLDYASLRRLRPQVIAVSMSGFGHTGPWRDYASYGPTLQALAGYSCLMRHAGGTPTGWGFSFSDMIAGSTAALATLFALWHRMRTGAGQFIDLSQLECLAALLAAQRPALASPDSQANSRAIDNRSQEMPSAPHGVYRCADRAELVPGDRWCAIAVFDESEWQRFCSAIGNPAWVGDPRFRTLRQRIRHSELLDAHVEAWTRARTAENAADCLQRHQIAAAVVADARDLCELDPHLRSRGYFSTIPTLDGSTVRVDGAPIRLSATPAHLCSPAPLLAEHTDTVLQTIGMTLDEITTFRKAKVVA